MASSACQNHMLADNARPEKAMLRRCEAPALRRIDAGQDIFSRGAS